ncbi:MAG: 4Fe-4S dicluster domain-containing protein [Nitrospiraceae bacterium]|nr:4Fe-4S dicluster domain-containing protein [Nitrospiraceae bacterium]
MDSHSEKVKESVPAKDERRGFLKKFAAVAGGALAMSTVFGKATKVFAKAQTIVKKSKNKSGGYNTPAAGTGQVTGPIRDHRWMGWMNPSFDADDGWNEWHTIENPENLPIWHDNFHKIKGTYPKHKWAMVMDLRRCVGCQACVIACKSENKVPLGVFRTVVQVQETGHMEKDNDGIVITEDGNYMPNVKKFMLPLMCNHCEHPPCVAACPVKATFKRQDGIVLVNYDKCIGCGTCVQACPYAMRFLNPVQKTADKCTLCVHRVNKGLAPACVTSCVGRARVFGDLLDPKSEVSRLVAANSTSRLRLEQGTEPQVYYINLDGNLVTPTNSGEVKQMYTYAMGFNTAAYEKLGGKVLLPVVEEEENPYKAKAGRNE